MTRLVWWLVCAFDGAHRRNGRLEWLALLLALIVPAQPLQAAATNWIGDDRATARLVTVVAATGSGSTVDAGLEIRLAPGWHTYWRSPGEAGLPPHIDWQDSTNLSHTEIAWPAPKRISIQGLQGYVYEDHVLLPIVLSLGRPGAPLALHAALTYGVCKEVCIPYSAHFDLALPAGVALADKEAALISAARAHVPAALAADGMSLLGVTVTPAKAGATLEIRLRSMDVRFGNPDLFVEGIPDVAPPQPVVVLSNSAHEARFSIPIAAATPRSVTDRPLRFTLVDGQRSSEFTTTPAPGAAGYAAATFLSVIGVALLGGLILNIMPCVLPVLSLKLLSVAEHVGAGQRQVRYGLLATAAGVLTSFALLASLLLALKASGNTIGWGIQFQWPWFVAAMATLTTLFAASLWDWLAIALPRWVYDAATAGPGAGQGHRPLTDSFLTGAFATLLATPCSAPFVGTAIGFALAQGPTEIIAVFMALGLGFALPYLTVAAVPKLARFLPRPGPWMNTLRKILGVALIATALWLLYVLASLSGLRVALESGGALAIALAVLAWRTRVAPAGAAIAIRSAPAILAAAAVLIPTLAGVAATRPAEAVGHWQPFDLQQIRQEVGEGKVVFVHVTADWCLTCKVNETTVLDREPVRSRLFGGGVIAVRADWTRPDPAVTAYLQSFGRYGVPFDAVYGPGQPDGMALPELLTPSLVTTTLDHAAAPRAAR
ncbi:MAG TPA: protein-disulfide reductase DsbD domain-containing protein [Pirellulales bacterium]|jgi:suppressor for copper-sensitivity B